jgi:hypothetical protein
MMAFDKSKDECVFVDEFVDRKTRITCELARYDGGQQKVALTRTWDGEFKQLGRLTKEEALAVAEMIGKAIEQMGAAQPSVATPPKSEKRFKQRDDDQDDIPF